MVRTCKYYRETMNSQGMDRFSKHTRLEFFVCPNCKAVYERFMDMQYRELSDQSRWWNPQEKDFEPC